MAMDLQRLMSLLRQCMQRYDMVSAGDKIAVGLSGGKDSLTLLMGLKHLQRFYPVPYGLCAIHVGSGAPGSEADVETMRQFCEGLDVPFYFVDAKVYQIVFEIRKEKHPCSLCAKLRRGALNDKAMALGCNKIAYAHHQDDFIETSLMNLMLEGHYDCFPPVTHLDRTNLQVLRPMLMVKERDVIGFARRENLPVVKNPCPADGHTRRQDVKNFIRRSRDVFPQGRECLYASLLDYFDRNVTKMQKTGKNHPKTIFLVKNNKSFRKKYEKMAHLAEKNVQNARKQGSNAVMMTSNLLDTIRK